MAGVHGGPRGRPTPARGEMVLVKLHHLGSVLQAQRIRAELDGLISDGHERIALDVTDLDYAGSVAAAGVLAGYAKRASAGVRIGIVADEPEVAEMLTRNGCAEMLDVFSSVAEATAGCDEVVTADADYDRADGVWRAEPALHGK